MQILRKKGYKPSTILPMGEICYLKTTANLSTGGTATDVTDKVHPKNIALFNRIARTIGLDICGIDIMAKSLEVPIMTNQGAIIEVNAAPGFRMHLHPSKGKPRNVAAPVVDMLFPGENKGLIPVIAITGTNGKTTTTGLTAHICRQHGLVTGHTSTQGVFIQDEQVMEGDCSGPNSALMVLKDPSVEMAVLECARGGILRKGLGFEACDTAIVTNIAEDHLGIGGIDTLEELAEVKAVVPRSVRLGGYAVLNADDDHVYNMRTSLQCRVALFSLDASNERIIEHCEEGGIAAVRENNGIVIIKGDERIPVTDLENIPVTFNGKAEFNIANALGAVLATFVNNIPLSSIREGLKTFNPSPEQNPGRMNIFKFRDFSVMIDYAHNPHGVKALGKFIKNYSGGKKTGIIAGVGDRRDEDLVALGKEAGQVFDEIIIRSDDDMRGRTTDEVFKLVNTGIQSVCPGKQVQFIADEAEAVRAAISMGEPGGFVVVLVDNVSRALSIASGFNEENKTADGSMNIPLHERSVINKIAI